MKYIYSIVSICILAISTSISAHEIKAGNIEINHPWAKSSRPGQQSGAGFFLELKNIGDTEDKLLSASSSIAATTELHNMRMEGEIMKMYAVPFILIPAGSSVEVAPKKHHIMFLNLKKPLVKGERFPVDLVFEKAGKVTVEFHVEASDFNGGTAHGHGEHPHEMHKH